MGLFEHWPYTNYHDLNLDWIIKEIKNFRDSMSSVNEVIERLEQLISDSDINTDIGRVQNASLDTDAMQLIYNAAKSYETNVWSISQHHIDYGNYLTNNPSGTSGTPIDPTGRWSVCNRFDCSSFVILSLMGIPYGSTAFAGTNQLAPRTTFTRYYKYKPRRNPDGLLRWASDIYEVAENNEMLLKINSLSDIRTGDVVFFKYTDDAWNSLPADSFAKADGGAYKRIAHVGIAVDSCTAFSSGVGLMHCVTTSAVMAFQDIESYDPLTLERVGYVMRPWKIRAIGSPLFTGFTTLRKRGSYTSQNSSIGSYTLTGSGAAFSGGRIPSDYQTGSIDLSTGAYVAGTGHITTRMIPYCAGLVIENPLSPNVVYKCFYYDGSGTFIGYTDNIVNRPSVAKQIRIMFSRSDGLDLTQAQIDYLNEHTIIRFHIMADALTSRDSSGIQNADCDTYYYFGTAPDFNADIQVDD